MVILILLYLGRDGNYPSEGFVQIEKNEDGFELIRNGKSFFIQGGGGSSHLKELSEFGGNTIRTWDTANVKQLLDSAHLYNLTVMVTLPMVKSRYLDFYKDQSNRDEIYSAFHNFVNDYKDHPALLMWILGNELDFPYRYRYAPFYQLYNRLVDMIHRIDPDHPVTTCLTNFSRRNVINLKLKVPGLDLISINTFGGKLQNLREELNDFSWFWSGPFILTEWGYHAPWENETTIWEAPIENSSSKKAEQLKELYVQSIPFENPRLLGTLVFYWGFKQERTHTWFSLFDENGCISESVLVLRNLWLHKDDSINIPELNYILINGRGSEENLFFLPGQENTAQAFFEKPSGDSLIYHWEILHEDWYNDNFSIQKNVIEDKLFINQPGEKIDFKTPLEEGPYRIFLTVYDKKGSFASANAPFYIVEHPYD